MPQLNRRGAFALLTGLAALSTASMASAARKPTNPDPSEVRPIWPSDPPGSQGVTAQETVSERSDGKGPRDRAVTHTRTPTLSLFRPRKPNGAAVILIPGGGYERVVMDKEGFETAQWLADRGYTCFVLLYRLPGDGWGAGPDAPLQDAQRALRLVRSWAPAMKVSPNRIAIMGFSAGGHLAASLTTRFEAQVYDRVDAADDLSARPDLSALIYPVITMTAPLTHAGSRKQLLGAAPSFEAVQAYSPEAGVGGRTPPVFLVHAADDKAVPVENSLMMFAALKAKAIPAELHVFEEGGHGFGLRAIAGKPVAAWPGLFEAYAKKKGI
ncbi:alpha/beta hydrolase [Caulobacter hibisci]|uniref:Alpha/beta hydrolase n=1 Tax=Caulobacter hibisci TaxID=2035993 RepID=A0ABS0T0C2_9CAUL|nr:alpha/beta hydrolase [Caulobacter hibisci]MBI1685313.1 alpha/beta hydrolase [Caulobacter hibisci]